MNLVRRLFEEYRSVSAKDLNALAKGAWPAVATHLMGIYRGDDQQFGANPNGLERGIFIGDAFRPDVPGGTSTVRLQPGVAAVFDTTEGDEFRGPVKPMFSDQDQPVEFPTNGASQDRIDSIFIRPVEVEEGEAARWFRDPTEDRKFQQVVDQNVRYGIETHRVAGTPGSSPSPPDPPTDGENWLRIADVERPSGQDNVQSSDVNDVRTADGAAFQRLFVSDFQVLKDNAWLTFEDDNAGTTYNLLPGSSPFEGLQIEELLTTLGGLILNRLAANELWAQTGSVLKLLDSAGSETDGSFQTPRIKSPWGSGGEVDKVYAQANSSSSLGDGSWHGRNTPLAGAVLKWDDTNSEFTVVESHNVDTSVFPISSNVNNIFVVPLDESVSAPSEADRLIGQIHPDKTSGDFATVTGSISDNGSGIAEITFAIRELQIDFGGSSTDVKAVEPVVDGTLVYLTAYYDRS